MLFNDSSKEIVRLLRFYAGGLLSVTWIVQILGVSFLLMRPIRSVSLLVIFTVIYLILFFVPGRLAWPAISTQRKLCTDLLIIYILFVVVLLFLPESFLPKVFFDGNGIVSTFFDLLGLFFMYSDLNYFKVPGHSYHLEVRTRRIIGAVFFLLSLLWLLNCGVSGSIEIHDSNQYRV